MIYPDEWTEEGLWSRPVDLNQPPSPWGWSLAALEAYTEKIRNTPPAPPLILVPWRKRPPA